MDCDKDNIEEFLPKKPIIGRRKQLKPKIKTDFKSESRPKTQIKITPAMQEFGDTDPFENAKEFVSFYRSIVRSYYDGRVDFPSHGADREYASVIMDDLIDIGREKDVDFLREWIKYYAKFKLKDNDFEDYRKTSIRQFKKTLDEYKKKHI